MRHVKPSVLWCLIAVVVLPLIIGIGFVPNWGVHASEPQAELQQTAPTGPQPGDIFREYHGGRTEECGVDATQRNNAQGNPACLESSRMLSRNVDNINLTDARRAEVAVQIWGGHIGTMEKQFALNRSKEAFGQGRVYNIANPRNTPNRAQCYFYNVLGTAITPIELSDLRSGTNSFRFRSGNQVGQPSGCNGVFNWGLFWVYGFTTRVYYNNSVAHPSGRVVTPASGATIGDNPAIVVEATPSAGRSITRVEVIGEYLDFDWDGNGVYREWQYRLENPGSDTRWTRIIGARTAPDSGSSNRYTFTWNTDWIPDQNEAVRLMARITDNTGMSYMTPATSASLVRTNRSVRMYTVPFGSFPQNFDVRDGRIRRGLDIAIPDGGLNGLQRARLVMSTWAGKATTYDPSPLTQIRINDTLVAQNPATPGVPEFGRIHNYNDDIINLPTGALRTGNNRFEMFGARTGHALEIHWPGPAILVETSGSSTPNRPPTITAPASLTVNQDTNLSITGLSIADPDAGQNNVETSLSVTRGTLKLNSTENLTIVSGADGSSAIRVRGRLAAINAALNGLVYRANAGYTGSDTLSISVSDLGNTGSGGPQTATREIGIAVNRVAGPITVTAGPNQTVDEGTEVTVTATFADSESNSHTATIDWGTGETTPGTVSQASSSVSGRFTYADNGTYTVRITVTDGQNRSGSATLTVTVRNAAPVVTAVGNLSVKRGEESTLVLATFVDPGSADTHTARIAWGDGSASADGVVDASTRSVSGTHTYSTNGSYTITVTVTDNDGARGEATLQVTVTDNPIVVPERNLETPAGQALTIDLLDGITGGTGTVSLVTVGEAANGTVTTQDDGLVTYQPNPGYSGTDSFTYTVRDSSGLNGSGAVLITVTASDGHQQYLPMLSQ